MTIVSLDIAIRFRCLESCKVTTCWWKLNDQGGGECVEGLVWYRRSAQTYSDVLPTVSSITLLLQEVYQPFDAFVWEHFKREGAEEPTDEGIDCMRRRLRRLTIANVARERTCGKVNRDGERSLATLDTFCMRKSTARRAPGKSADKGDELHRFPWDVSGRLEYVHSMNDGVT